MSFLAKTWLCIGLVLPLSAHATSFQMKTMVRTTYPEKVMSSSVHQLVQYILVGTGYKLYAGKNAPVDARKILAQKPPYQRQNVLMSRIDAILMAVGDQHSMVIDHENKLISVTRDPLYDQ